MPTARMHTTAALAAAALLFVPQLARAQFAASVAGYASGVGFQAGYTDPTRALGAPALTLDYQPWVDPFNPPYAATALVSIGAGGQLTLAFATPIVDAPWHRFGVDFIIHGNDGFLDIAWPNGVTDGSLFSSFEPPALSRVWVSADNAAFFELRPPAWASAQVDTYFPSDAAGTLGLPVNPALGPADFAGKDLAGIRALYAGSAGGTGFDLAWAVDAAGQPVSLDSVAFVKIEVLSGKVEVDAVVTVPEPAVGALLALGGTLWAAARRRVGARTCRPCRAGQPRL